MFIIVVQLQTWALWYQNRTAEGATDAGKRYMGDYGGLHSLLKLKVIPMSVLFIFFVVNRQLTLYGEKIFKQNIKEGQ